MEDAGRKGRVYGVKHSELQQLLATTLATAEVEAQEVDGLPLTLLVSTTGRPIMLLPSPGVAEIVKDGALGLASFITDLLLDQCKCILCPSMKEQDSVALVGLCEVGEHVEAFSAPQRHSS